MLTYLPDEMLLPSLKELNVHMNGVSLERFLYLRAFLWHRQTCSLLVYRKHYQRCPRWQSCRHMSTAWQQFLKTLRHSLTWKQLTSLPITSHACQKVLLNCAIWRCLLSTLTGKMRQRSNFSNRSFAFVGTNWSLFLPSSGSCRHWKRLTPGSTISA